MTFERPEAWALLALAVPIVVLHLRFLRRRDAEVSSLALWRELAPPGVGRRGFRRVEEAAQLLALLVALALFTAALAGPATGGGARTARRLVVVADVSASVNALVPVAAGAAPRTRFDDIRAAADAALAKLGPSDEVVVWAASARPRVVVEPTIDVTAARAALSALRPTLEPSGVRRTLDLVALSLGRDAAADVLVLTDAVGAADVARGPALPPSWRIGAAGAATARNAGIVAADVDAGGPGGSAGAELRLRVRVARTDGAGGRRTLVLRSPAGEAVRADVDVPDTGAAEATLPLDALPGGGPAVLRLEPPDEFPEDDAAVVLLAAPKRVRVAVVAPLRTPSPFLVATLRAMPDRVDADRAVLADPDAPAAAFADTDLIIAEARLPDAAPRDRPSLLFGAAGAPVERPLVWGTGRHPVLEGVDLAPLRIDRANVLDVGPSDRVLVECAEGPVAVATEAGGVRRLRFGFRPDATTLPLEPAFPVLVRNAIRWLGRPPLLPPSVRAGAPVATSEPLPPVERVWFAGPGAGAPRTVLVSDGAFAEVAPLPAPIGAGTPDFDGVRPGVATVRTLHVRGLPGDPATAVNWFPGDGFRLVPETPRATDAASAAAALPDRRAVGDPRTSWAAACALAGVASLVAGTLLLRRRRAAAAGQP